MICPHAIVASGLRWRGGDSMKSSEDTFDLSLSSGQRVVNRFEQAVEECNHPDCVIELPKDDELEEIAEGWSNLRKVRSSMYGRVLAIDGFLPHCIQQPDVEFSRDYCSDRKSIYRLNSTSGVNHLGRLFRFFAVATPGGTNEVRSYWRHHVLKEWIDRLRGIRTERHFGTDNAFPLSNELLNPFRQSQFNGNQYKDSYNYYLSKLWMHIEIAFRRLTTRFGLLRQKIRYSLEMQSMKLQVTAELHNYIINTNGVPTGHPLQLNANNQLDAAQPAANGILPLPDGMGENKFISVDFDAEEGRPSSRRDAISRPSGETSVQTFGFKCMVNTPHMCMDEKSCKSWLGCHGCKRLGRFALKNGTLREGTEACFGPWVGTYMGGNGTHGMDLTHRPIRVPWYPWSCVSIGSYP
jgi:hypothetical protein